MAKICDVLGPVKRKFRDAVISSHPADEWHGVVHMPEWKTYLSQGPYQTNTPLIQWYNQRGGSANGFDLLTQLFKWDPARRITARQALAHPWFQEDGGCAASSVFEGSTIPYPTRRVTHEDNGDAKMGSWVRASLSSSSSMSLSSQLNRNPADTRLPPSLAGGRLPSSSNFRPPTVAAAARC
jgi:cyclin-dependent kinase 8/11